LPENFSVKFRCDLIFRFWLCDTAWFLQEIVKIVTIKLIKK